MCIKWWTARLHRLARGFAQAQGGNVAITFAFAIIALIGSVGAAIDYSRAAMVRTGMQAALDATALMLAKSDSSLSSSQLQAQGSTIFAQLFTRPWATNVAVTVVKNDGNSTIKINGSASIDTAIMGIVGIPNIPVQATATAAFATSARLRVALVLDNTGSMASAGKMPALKTAAKNMLSKLNSAAITNGDVYVSIIPFATDVNVGASNYTASWIDWTGWEAKNGGSHSTWNGCVADRGDATGPNAGNYDTNVVSPTLTNLATLFPADQDPTCPVAMMGPSYNWSGMTNLINAMTPNGTTNQGVGLAWGWLALTQGSILNPPARASGYTYADHIVLLTDGLNTKNRWYGDQASIDARQALTCANIKAAGITLWTIQVNTGGDPTSTLLQQCATDAGKFFLLTSADQIISTFDAISFKITKLRLTN